MATPRSSGGRETLNVLQVGFGNFGPAHLAAWQRLGFTDRLIVADPSLAARQACLSLGLAETQVVSDYSDHLETADVVDIVSATDTHFDIATAALEAGCEIFLEKPVTPTLGEARELAERVEASGRCLQVGFYFRFHPLGQALKARVDGGFVGDIRYLSSRFTGFKRGRTDSGVVLNDAIHFIDLQNWLLGGYPVEVRATLRDHFDRGFEDMALVQMRYPNDVVAQIEAGCTLPGRWNDNIVPGATATKEITLAGSDGAIEADFVTERMICHEVRHALDDGVWRPQFGNITRPHTATAQPVDVIRNELDSFLDHIVDGTRPDANIDACGVRLAQIIDAIFVSARERRSVRLDET